MWTENSLFLNAFWEQGQLATTTKDRYTKGPLFWELVVGLAIVVG